MTPDKFQEAWRAESSQTRITVDAELLRKEVERNQRDFRALILRRDTLEVGVALLSIPVWSMMGAWFALPWTWYLCEPAMLWVAGFFLVDRWRHPQRPIEPGAPLVETVKESLHQVDHQIWLLRNVFWWYLLPLFVTELIFFAHVTGDVASLHWLFGLGFGSFLFAFLVVINGFVDYINQRAVRVQLVPRRQELLTLLASLGGEPVAEISKSSSQGINPVRRWFVVTLLGAIAAVIMALAFGKVTVNRFEKEAFVKKSPFAAVRWQESRPEVKVGDEWYQLLSLDDVSTDEILAFSRQKYGNRWQKRFEEDLVELLSRMGHPPRDTVKLEVRSITSQQTEVLPDVPMTTANRQAIKAAADARENADN